MGYKTYSELDLKSIRDQVGIDFAHFTYKPGMCSCCYGPKDLPKRYWNADAYKRVMEGSDAEYTYLLFKNADNGSGCVKRSDPIKDYTYIQWACSTEQLEEACRLLQDQLGSDYSVNVPESELCCIEIRYNGD